MKERGFLGPLHVTSAKTGEGCDQLREAIVQAILTGINWDDIPCRTTELLFKRLKEEILRLKDEGRGLMRFNELRETLQQWLSGEFKRFADEELRAVLTLLAATLRWIADGRFHIVTRHAMLQADEHQRGCLMEERREIRSPKSEGEARRRGGTVRPAGHAPDAGGARHFQPVRAKENSPAIWMFTH